MHRAPAHILDRRECTARKRIPMRGAPTAQKPELQPHTAWRPEPQPLRRFQAAPADPVHPVHPPRQTHPAHSSHSSHSSLSLVPKLQLRHALGREVPLPRRACLRVRPPPPASKKRSAPRADSQIGPILPILPIHPSSPLTNTIFPASSISSPSQRYAVSGPPFATLKSRQATFGAMSSAFPSKGSQ
jgi:hypothetical protein